MFDNDDFKALGMDEPTWTARLDKDIPRQLSELDWWVPCLVQAQSSDASVEQLGGRGWQGSRPEAVVDLQEEDQLLYSTGLAGAHKFAAWMMDAGTSVSCAALIVNLLERRPWPGEGTTPVESRLLELVLPRLSCRETGLSSGLAHWSQNLRSTLNDLALGPAFGATADERHARREAAFKFLTTPQLAADSDKKRGRDETQAAGGVVGSPSAKRAKTSDAS